MILPFPQPQTFGAGLTVADVLLPFCAFIRRRWAATTWAARRGFLHRFLADHGSLPVSQLRKSTLENWIADQTTYANDWTRAQAAATLKRAFRWATDDALIERNPFAGVRCPTGLARQPVDAQAFQRLLRNSSADLRRVLTFLRCTGCRPGELAALRWDHLALEQRLARLPDHKTRRTQRKPKPRTIHLSVVALKLIAWLRRQPLASWQPHVFLNSRGRPYTTGLLGKRLREARCRAGLPAAVKLYGLRHAFGTQAVLNAVDLATLSELLGHCTTRTTEHYLHLAGRHDHLQAAVRQATLFTMPRPPKPDPRPTPAGPTTDPKADR